MKKKIFFGVLLAVFVLLTVPINSAIKSDFVENKQEVNKNEIDEKQIKSNYDQKINLLMKLCRVPSLSICIIRNNTILLSKGYGFYDIKNSKKASNETIYPAGSITKTVTATAIMQLIENESYNLCLDDNVSNYLPFDLKNPKYPDINITFRMLLAHQSSLSDIYVDFPLYFVILGYPHEWLKEYVTPGGDIYNPKVWRDFAPGENVNYSSVGMEILGYLVELLSGQTYADYCEEHIFQPLDMNNSGFHLSDFDYNKIAIPYTTLFGLYIKLPFIDSKADAHGGLYTTVFDLSHYLLAYMNGGEYNGTRILKKETIENITTLQYPNSTDYIFRYGLGWWFWNNTNLNGEWCGGHAGDTLGGSANMVIRFSDNVGIIYFWNQFKFIRMYLNLDPLLDYFSLKIEKYLFNWADELK